MRSTSAPNRSACLSACTPSSTASAGSARAAAMKSASSSTAGSVRWAAMLSALLWGAVAASSLVLGALLALARPWPERSIGLVMAFGAGALISAVSYELFEEGVEAAGQVPGRRRAHARRALLLPRRPAARARPGRWRPAARAGGVPRRPSGADGARDRAG